MKITISKSQWEDMGKKAGWMKTAAAAPATGAPQQPHQISLDQVSTALAKMGQPGLAEKVYSIKDPKEVFYFQQASQGNKPSLDYLLKKYIHAQPIK